LKGSC